ncbi:hypothetical protein PMAYCL1PPCAC_26738, partial [Pristionchus mayeri]
FQQMEQFFNLLELPREMITEVVKRADYEGLLALREVCILTKELVDEESRKIDPVRKISFNDPSVSWNIAFDTISRLKLNSVYMGVHNSMEQKLQIADAVVGLILFKDHHKRPENPVSQAVQLLSRRCSHLELEAAWLSEDEMEQAIRELARFEKKVYLYTRVNYVVTNRTVRVGSLNVNIVDNSHLEIYHDGMRRRNIS